MVEISAAIDDRLVMLMAKIAQWPIVKIEERSQNNDILIGEWRGWMPPTAEKRRTIVDVLFYDCGGGIEFSQPLDNVTGHW